MKYLLLSCALLSGCSLVWHNRDYPVQSNVGQCPTSEWPIGVDGFGFLATGIAASGIYLYRSKIDQPAEQIYVPLYMLTAVFLVSALGGLGEIVSCARQENQ